MGFCTGTTQEGRGFVSLHTGGLGEGMSHWGKLGLFEGTIFGEPAGFFGFVKDAACCTLSKGHMYRETRAGTGVRASKGYPRIVSEATSEHCGPAWNYELHLLYGGVGCEGNGTTWCASCCPLSGMFGGEFQVFARCWRWPKRGSVAGGDGAPASRNAVKTWYYKSQIGVVTVKSKHHVQGGPTSDTQRVLIEKLWLYIGTVMPAQFAAPSASISPRIVTAPDFQCCSSWRLRVALNDAQPVAAWLAWGLERGCELTPKLKRFSSLDIRLQWLLWCLRETSGWAHKLAAIRRLTDKLVWLLIKAPRGQCRTNAIGQRSFNVEQVGYQAAWGG
ncbi:predicted protein [Pyrenophora tritici-repentis Pt-1C-BFP]|uniref:Uncharacterized protein n=1 Tax=Pyrenophora tritici-repentis (strain Pt-1C-BFP) TaxID=426418 RepID=B2W6M4_PYRTR|nr:uncharacterized protein PTRG_05462 [Pyrenophora tritici-repentis Pt-1C-BFP]EDU48382.1 predicted protein [Pyrenophora tritici-repentis Pt-1C-BFP]